MRDAIIERAAKHEQARLDMLSSRYADSIKGANEKSNNPAWMFRDEQAIFILPKLFPEMPVQEAWITLEFSYPRAYELYRIRLEHEARIKADREKTLEALYKMPDAKARDGAIELAKNWGMNDYLREIINQGNAH